MSVDTCNVHNSIFIKKVKQTRVVVVEEEEAKSKKSFSKLQSLVASVSKRRKDSGLLNKYASTTSLPSEPLKPPTRLRPSISARPFSQFFFPIKEEPANEAGQQTTTKKKINKRHSVAVDLVVDDMVSASSSSRSSSLKTIRNQAQLLEDNVVITTNSDIVVDMKKQNNRLSGVARARTVLRLDSNKTREIKAIHVWKDTVSQLSLTDNYEAEQDLYHILSHPALLPDHPLERQRFVRHSTPKDVAMMKFILNELTETETSYNQLLQLIKNRYMEPMIAASQSKDPLVKSTDIPILFNHLKELIDLSNTLSTSFNKTTKCNIGQVFKSIESDLVVFLKYAMHYRTNIKSIRRACSNVLFVKIDQENLARRDTNRLGMSDYFIAPIQRIPRYCLLIKDLQKYTHPTDSTYTDLAFALKTLTGLAVAMDHVQNKAPTRTSIRTL
ncbi:Dbl homology domain-containing protein [Helicostylum pulchrum]|uniref:DH domain-containing protein n=1 Tax=Helicostylum pulchrum TaxID=562976 RepID=A0ABP9XUB7_9FUNG|nr:Dbl homology domain-containing protein [Helicostylum pulchrum]